HRREGVGQLHHNPQELAVVVGPDPRPRLLVGHRPALRRDDVEEGKGTAGILAAARIGQQVARDAVELRLFGLLAERVEGPGDLAVAVGPHPVLDRAGVDQDPFPHAAPAFRIRKHDAPDPIDGAPGGGREFSSERLALRVLRLYESQLNPLYNWFARAGP